jgi:microcystin-dependent protein
MAELYVITDTRGVDQFVIKPGDTNSDTDLKLPGKGAVVWGENLDENSYRLMENFAVEEKGGSPGNPQDSTDLGAGNGINNPLEGQTWWNLTQKKLYTFDGTDWQKIGTSTGSVPPSPASEGDLWFDDVAQQLKVFNGTIFVSAALQYLRLDGASQMSGALDMGTNLIRGLAGPPTLADDATNKDYVDNEISILTGDLGSGSLDSLYVNITGDTMTDRLTLSANPLNAFHAATKDYVDNGIAALTVTLNTLDGFRTGDIKESSAIAPPSGWLLCDGSTIGDDLSGADFEGSEFELLFDVLNLAGAWGNPGGADFNTGGTVKIPDLRGRSPLGTGTGESPALTPRALGVEYGQENVTLSTAQMPAHTHTAPSLPHSNVNIPTGSNPRQLGFPGGGPPTGSTGGGTSHPNVHPTLGVNYFIKIFGTAGNSPDFLPLIGGTMFGNIDMGGSFITTLPTPVNPEDAANKEYVDTTVSAAITSGNWTYLPQTALAGLTEIVLMQSISMAGVTDIEIITENMLIGSNAPVLVRVGPSGSTVAVGYKPVPDRFGFTLLTQQAFGRVERYKTMRLIRWDVSENLWMEMDESDDQPGNIVLAGEMDTLSIICTQGIGGAARVRYR